MAPEILIKKDRYDSKVDVWSFGIFAYELTHGEAPYNGDNLVRIYANIVNMDPPKIDTNEWSPDFCNFVDMCLKKNPEERWTTDQLLNHNWLYGAMNFKMAFITELMQ